MATDNILSYKFIVNPSAGHGNYKRVIHEIRRAISECDSSYEISIPNYKGEAISIAKTAADNYDVVVAVGGDGTINEVLNGIMGTQAILGIIPAGTGNGFAREFNIPLHIKEACKVLLDGNVKWVDVGKSADRYFLGTAGLGFDALIAKFAGEVLGPFRGMWLYFFAGLLILYKYNPALISVKIDSQTVKVSPLLVAIANTRRYGGRALIAPGAKPDDGLFDVCVVKHMRELRLLWNLPKLFKGEHTNLSEVSIYRGSEVLIDAPVPVPIHVDGEPLDSCCEVQFTLLKRALRILVPKTHNHEDSIS